MKKYTARIYMDEVQDFYMEVLNSDNRKCVFEYANYFGDQKIDREYHKWFNRIGDVYYNHIFRDIPVIDEIYYKYEIKPEEGFELLDEVEYYLPD